MAIGVGIALSVSHGGGAWSPASVAGLNARFDDTTGLFTDTGATTPCSADGQSVARWNNSANSINFQQATAGLRPLYKTAGGVALNGYPIVRFDGVDDFMETGSYVVAQPVTGFVVVRSKTWVSTRRVLDGVGVDRCVLNQYDSGSEYGLYAGTAFACFIEPGVTDTWHILCCRWNAASSSIRINAGAPSSGNPGSTGITDGRTLGNHWNGTSAAQVDVAAYWEYAANVSTADETAIRNWLNTKYAVF